MLITSFMTPSEPLWDQYNNLWAFFDASMTLAPFAVLWALNDYLWTWPMADNREQKGDIFCKIPFIFVQSLLSYTRRQYRSELKNILASDYLVWGENLIFVFLSISARPTSLNLNFSLNARLTHQQSGLKSTS